MKKLFTLIIILTFAFSVTQAQLVVRYTSDHVVSTDPSSALEIDAKVINTSNNSMVIKIVRNPIVVAVGHTSNFCWGVTCYTPTTFISSPFTLAPKDSSNVLITYSNPGGTIGLDQVTYTVYDVADSMNDHVISEFTYDFSTGITPLQANNAHMNCYQSSLDETTNISYSISNFREGKLVIRNLLGSVVKQIPLSDKQGTLTVSTAELPAGMYMYLLYNNNEPVATKKMIITHR